MWRQDNPHIGVSSRKFIIIIIIIIIIIVWKVVEPIIRFDLQVHNDLCWLRESEGE